MEGIAASEPTVMPKARLALLYGSTILLGAFLLFQVQPLIGKILLPWFGGSAAVWSTCLLFFQGVLLAGYLYAHLLVRLLKPRMQAAVHIALLVLSVALLRILPDPGMKPPPTEDPTLLIALLLATTVGLPYFLLSTTGPLMQAWFSREKPGAVPYRLFALSNFGSMLGLLSYPLLFEPFLALPSMSSLWSVCYALFCLLAAVLAWRVGRLPAPPTGGQARVQDRPSWTALLTWTWLAALATVFLMAVSSHLTQNVAPVPFLWVLPLALYLLSFILCFESERWYRREIFLPLFLLWLPLAAWDLMVRFRIDGVGTAVLLFSAGLFLACMICHGELARLKPRAQHLTVFYLMVALGGALGGAFVVLVAPRLFNGDHELPLVAVLTAVTAITLLRRYTASRLVPVAALGVGIVAVLVTIGLQKRENEYLLSTRNFYGTLKVAVRGQEHSRRHELVHGMIIHGSQYLTVERRTEATTYYGPDSGVGRAIVATRSEGRQHVGVVGLGTGTLAAWGRGGDRYRFYEINPAVERLARSHFSYLADTGAATEVIGGDARLVLEREQAQQFDVLAVDAFSGDAIPVHLLTREAFAIYQRHLKRGGIIAVHVSNRNLDLNPIVMHGARHIGWHARLVKTQADDNADQNASSWMLLAKDDAVFEHEALTAAEAVEAAPVQAWTDDYSSLISVIKAGK